MHNLVPLFYLLTNALSAGISSLSDLLEAQTALQNTLDQRTEAKTNYQTKLSLYLQAIGK